MHYYEVIMFKFHVDRFSQTEPVTAPSSKRKTSCESYPAIDIGSRCLLYCYTMGSDLSQPTSTSLFPTTSRFVPIAKEFLCVMCSFSTANNLSIPTCEPNLFDGFLPLGSRSVCYVCSYTVAFSTAVCMNWPANLMCWIVLP